MTSYEEIVKILQDEVERLAGILEKGGQVTVRGGYISHTYKESVIDRHCSSIVEKLSDLGYSYTTNHGHGCRDFHFTKQIKL